MTAGIMHLHRQSIGTGWEMHLLGTGGDSPSWLRFGEDPGRSYLNKRRKKHFSTKLHCGCGAQKPRLETIRGHVLYRDLSRPTEIRVHIREEGSALVNPKLMGACLCQMTNISHNNDLGAPISPTEQCIKRGHPDHFLIGPVTG